MEPTTSSGSTTSQTSPSIATTLQFFDLAKGNPKAALAVLEVHPTVAKNLNEPQLHALLRMGGDDPLFLRLIDCGIRLDWTAGGTLIYHAIEHERFQIAAKLLEKGAPFKNKNPVTGQTALHAAVKKKAIFLIRTLVAKGADIHDKDHHDLSPLDLANASKNPAVIDAISAKPTIQGAVNAVAVYLADLIAKKATLSDEDCRTLWEQFPDLAAMHVDYTSPQLAKQCPWTFLEPCLNNPEKAELLVKLLRYGAKIPPYEWSLLCKTDPERIVKLLDSVPDLARESPTILLDTLSALPLCQALMIKLIACKAQTHPRHITSALRYNLVAVAEALLDAQVSVPVSLDSYKMSALHYAVQYRAGKVIARLTALLTLKNGDGLTPRMYALQQGAHAEAAELLRLELSAAICAQDRLQTESLLAQCQELSPDLFINLCKALPDLACSRVTAQLAKGLSPTDVSAFCKEAKYRDLLISLQKAGAGFPLGALPDLFANGHIECAKALIASFTPSPSEKEAIEKSFNDPETPNLFTKLLAYLQVAPDEFYALGTAYPLLMQKLISTNPTLAKSCTDTAFNGLLAAPGNDALLTTILTHNSSAGATALSFALRHNRQDIATTLLELGTSVDAPDSDLMTPLHYAAKQENLDLVKTLLAKNAQTFAKNVQGKTPSMLTENPKIRALLIEKELHGAIFTGDTDSALFLLNQGVDVTHVSDTGASYLEEAVPWPGHLSVTKRLLELGADPFYGKCTALMRCLPYKNKHVHWLARTLPEPMKKYLLEEDSFPAHRVLIEACKKDAFVLSCCSQESTPLECAILLKDTILAKAIMQKLPERLQLQGIEILCNRYPKSVGSILDFFFSVDEQHMFVGNISLFSNLPPKQEPRDLEKLCTKLTEQLTQVCQPDEKLPLDGLTYSRDDLCTGIKLFYSKVKARGVYAGPATDAKQYDFVENVLISLAIYLEKFENHPLFAERVKDISVHLGVAGSLCFLQYLQTAMSLYNKHLLEVAPSMDNTVLLKLQTLRRTIIEGAMIKESFVEESQSVHSIAYMGRILGKPLQLADRELYADELRYERTGFKDSKFPDLKTLLESFYRHYRPSLIFDCIRSALQENSIKETLLDWAKKELKEYFPDKKTYKDNKQALKAKEKEVLTGQAKKEDLLALAKEQQLYVPAGFTPTTAHKDARRGDVNAWLVDEETGACKIFPIICMLIKQQVITFTH